jgi:hypothetical protein
MPYTPGQFKWRVILMYTIAIMAALVTFFLTYRYLSDKKLQYRAKLDALSRPEAKYVVEFISPVTFEVVKSFELVKSEMMASKNSVTVIYADGEILVWTGPYRIRHP